MHPQSQKEKGVLEYELSTMLQSYYINIINTDRHVKTI